jgi:hypothetical protein
MVDVEFSTGNRRFPVEDLQRFDDNGNADPPGVDSVPAGAGTVSVPGGPGVAEKNLIKRVATAFEKKSLYWASKDRQYRMSRPEVDSGSPCCPKCGPDYPLKRAIYKRRDNSSERLMGCPGCMFLIKDADIVNFGPVSAEEIEIEGRTATLKTSGLPSDLTALLRTKFSEKDANLIAEKFAFYYTGFGRMSNREFLNKAKRVLQFEKGV